MSAGWLSSRSGLLPPLQAEVISSSSPTSHFRVSEWFGWVSSSVLSRSSEPSSPVSRLKPNELEAARKELASAGFPNSAIRGFDDKPLDAAALGKPIDVLMDVE